MRKVNKSTTGHSIGGFLLIAIGGLFLLDSLHIMDFGHFTGEWWPIILILVGISKFRKNRQSSGLLLIVLGAIFLSTTLGIINLDRIWRFWPLILIGIGLQIIFRSRGNQSLFKKDSVKSDDEYFNLYGIFNGNDHRIHSQSFKGGEAFVLFGGLDIDLTKATAHPEGCNFSFTTIFGGIDVEVPEDWSVVTSGTSIFGGISDKTSSNKEDSKKSVNLNGIVLFGGIEIRN
ncbi:MAG: hypothetical protein HQ509_09290 [Candidatus Marinimicrobia bacterium]|nr:hypothetical protein [Candidatus Neomarinimicrobiota bacterium]